MLKNGLLSGILLGTICLASCSKSTDPATNKQPAGRRVLLTPTTNEAVQGYLGAGAISADQSLWVAARYGTQGKSMLLHLDTLGQLLSSRSVLFQAPAFAYLPAVDVLTDGGVIVLGSGSVGQPLLARLAADGSTTWSKQIAAAPLGGTTVVGRSMVAVGNDALLCSQVGGEFAFGRVKADGTAQAYNSYQLAAPYISSGPPVFRALPGGQGALFMYQTDATVFLLARLTADGQLQWLRQLSVADLPPSTTGFRMHLAASATSGNLVAAIVPLGGYATGTFQAVRLSAAGNLLSATKYAPSDNSYPLISAVALDAQDQLSWMTETIQRLNYYTTDAQGNQQVGKQVSTTPTYPSGNPVTFTAFGIVTKTARYTYALGTLAGPAPANEPEKGINFLAINADGQAGCQLADAPSLLKTSVPGTQVTAQVLPTATSRPVTVTNYALANTAFSLSASSVCP